MQTRGHTAFSVFWCLLACVASGCANVSLERPSVEKLPNIHVIQVVTPTLDVPTFLQAAVRSGAVGGIVPAAVASTQARSTSTVDNDDVGAMIASGVKQKISEKISWWPQMTSHGIAVPSNYVYAEGAWLRVEVVRYEIAPFPLQTLFIVVNVSLRNANDRGEPSWVTQIAFSGATHGGQKIVLENFPKDSSQLNRETERAVNWIVNEIATDLR